MSQSTPGQATQPSTSQGTIEQNILQHNPHLPQNDVPQRLTESFAPIVMAPAQVLRGSNLGEQVSDTIARLGQRPLVVGGDRSLQRIQTDYAPLLQHVHAQFSTTHPDNSAGVLQRLDRGAMEHNADVILGVGGGKALDTAKLLAHNLQLPVVTIPTSAATCAAWTALSNLYSDEGAFLHDVVLPRCPDLLILDYGLILTAPTRTLVAGIGDALAKWYEASVSSGHVTSTLIVAAVQQARVLRDILFQRSAEALHDPGGGSWREVVDATVLMAGMIGGLGGAQCRTVAAHAVHNGLTHLPMTRTSLHGEKVAYGILVQLRLEELVQGNQLAATARQQLLKFYESIGLPCQLEDLGMNQVTLAQLQQASEIACQPDSDIHRLPFTLVPTQLLAAMVSTKVPDKVPKASIRNN